MKALEALKALEVGNIIKLLLLSSDEVTALVGRRVFSVVAPEKTVYPFIAYRRAGVTPHGTKDHRSICDTVEVEITVEAANYTQSVDVAKAVLNALRAPIGDMEGIEVDEIRLIPLEEDGTETSYVQIIKCEIDIINN